MPSFLSCAPRRGVVVVLLGALVVASSVSAQSRADPIPSRLDAVQVTATRFGDPIQEVPGAISVVTGDELRDRGATDLRTALALVAGVGVAPVSDAGPGGPVPNLLGAREVDDLLLLIDGIPAGGAYAPQTVSISLVNVERIEILRGAAPVYFGTTAFAGTINVIHYAAGSAERSVSLRYGTYGSVGASGSTVLSSGALRQSLSLEVGDDRYSDARARQRRAQASWRLATELAGGAARADLNVLSLRQKPTSPTPVDIATGRFTTLLPVDFNQNPANARLDTDRSQLVLGYERPLGFGQWGTTLSYTDSQTDAKRAFIDTGDTPQPWSPQTRADVEAFSQNLHQRDLFFDTHLTTRLVPALDLTTGVNALVGHADADSVRENFSLLLDGQAMLPNLEDGAPRGTVRLGDRRRFLGVYAQSRYRVTPDASLLAGLRWNRTHEVLDVVRVNSRNVVTSTSATQDLDRLSGSFGAQWRVFRSSEERVDGLTLHASVGNTFQPAQIGFGPNPEAAADGGGLLKPETERSVVAGIRADLLDGHADIDVDAFYVDFDNQPVLATSGGTSVLRPAGRQRYRGVDVEGALRPTSDWTLKANVTWSDARFRDFVTEIDGTPTQLSGKRQVLAPRWRAAAGLIYAPSRAWRGSLTAAYTGARYLDLANRFRAAGFTVVDASFGYRFDRATFIVSANNLTNRRDAIAPSELGEEQFYRMPSRRVTGVLTVPLP